MNYSKVIKKFPELVDVYDELFQSFKIQNHSSVENAMCSLLNITKSYFRVFTKKLSIQRAERFTVVLKTLIIHLHIRFTGLNKISQNVLLEQNLFLELLSSLLDFFLFLSQNNKSYIKNAVKDLLLFTGNCPRNIGTVLLKCSLVKKKYSDCCYPLLQHILHHAPVVALPPKCYMQYIFLYRLWKICCSSYKEKHKILCLATKLTVSPEETAENELFIEKFTNCFSHYDMPFSIKKLYSPEYWIMKKFPPGFFQDVRKILCDDSVSFHQHDETNSLKGNAHMQDTEKADDNHDDLGGSIQFKQLLSTDMTCNENDFSNTDYFVEEMEDYDSLFVVDNRGRTTNKIQKNISVTSPIKNNKNDIEKFIDVNKSKGLKRKLISSQGKANKVNEKNVEAYDESILKKVKQDELSHKLYDNEENSSFILKSQNDVNNYGKKYLFEAKGKKRKKNINSDVHTQNDGIKEFSLSQQEFQEYSVPSNTEEITQVEQNLFKVSLKSHRNSNITVVNEENLKIPVETQKNNKNHIFSTNPSEATKLDKNCTNVILHDKNERKKLRLSDNEEMIIEKLHVNLNKTLLNSSNNIAVFDDSLSNLNHNSDKAFLSNSTPQNEEYESDNFNANVHNENEDNNGLDSLQMFGRKYTSSDGEINTRDNCELQEKISKQEVNINSHAENEGKNKLVSTQVSRKLCTLPINEKNIEISSTNSSGALLRPYKNPNDLTIIHSVSTLKYENSNNQLELITSELQQEKFESNLCINSCEVSSSFQRLSDNPTISEKNSSEHITNTFITGDQDNIDFNIQETILFHSIPKKKQSEKKEVEKSNKLEIINNSCMESNISLPFQQQFQNFILSSNIEKMLQCSPNISSENCEKSLNDAINDEKHVSVIKVCEEAKQGKTQFPEEEAKFLFDDQSNIQAIEKLSPLNEINKISHSFDSNSNYDNLVLTEMESKSDNFDNNATFIDKLLSISPLKETDLTSQSSDIGFCVKLSQNFEEKSVNQLLSNNDDDSKKIMKEYKESLHGKEITNDNTNISVIKDCKKNEQIETCLVQVENDKSSKSSIETTEELSLSNEVKKNISSSDSSDNSELDLSLPKLLTKIESTAYNYNTSTLNNIPLVNNQHETLIKNVSDDIQDSSIDTVNMAKTYHVYMLETPNKISQFIIADEATSDIASKSVLLNKESANPNDEHSVLKHKLIESNQCSDNTQNKHCEILRSELNVNDVSNFNANICEISSDVSGISQEVQLLNTNVLKCNEASSKVDSLISSSEKEHGYNNNYEICKDRPTVERLHIEKCAHDSPKVSENSIGSNKYSALSPLPNVSSEVNLMSWKCDGPDFSDICKKMDFRDVETAFLNPQITKNNSPMKLTGGNGHCKSEEFEDDEFHSLSSDCESQISPSPYKIKKLLFSDLDKNNESFQNEKNHPNCKTVVNSLKNMNLNSSTNGITTEVCEEECICEPLTPIPQSASLPETSQKSGLSKKQLDDKNITPKRYNLRNRKSLIVPAKFN